MDADVYADMPPLDFVTAGLGVVLDPRAWTETDLTTQQLEVLEAVAAGKHVFLTGRGGCGKTETIRALGACLDAAKVPYAITAYTGIAAEPLRGTTLHSLLCLNDLNTAEACARQLRRIHHKHAAVASLRVLVIDEVSMLSPRTFELALRVLRLSRRSFMPMPVLVLAGDFLQLPAVKAPPLLLSDAWTALAPVVVCLTTNFRQAEDPEFAALLDECRVGAPSESTLAKLEARVGVVFKGGVVTEIHPHKAAVNSINSAKLRALPAPKVRYCAHVFLGRDTRAEGYGGGRSGDPDSTDDPSPWDDDELQEDLGSAVAPTSYAKQDPQGQNDHWRLDLCEVPPTEPLRFWARAYHKPSGARDVPPEWGRDVRVELPPDPDTWTSAEQLVREALCGPELELAVGALVMFTANVDPPVIVNGTQGVVVDFHATGKPVVQLLRTDERVIVSPWPCVRRVHQDKDTVYVVMAQLPLQHAWAITVHKAQGKTLDRAKINLGPSVFEASQAYVALSRVRTLAGVALTDFRPSSIFADQAIVEWYAQHGGSAESIGPSIGPSPGPGHGPGFVPPPAPEPGTRPMRRHKRRAGDGGATAPM